MLRYFKHVGISRDKHYPNRSDRKAPRICYINITILWKINQSYTHAPTHMYVAEFCACTNFFRRSHRTTVCSSVRLPYENLLITLT